MHQYRVFALLIASLTLLSGCSRRPRENARADEPSTVSVPLNDSARFLAGLPGRAGGPFHDLESTEEWKNYSSEIGRAWNQAQNEQFKAVDAFQKRELAAPESDHSFVFYPFSGPDVLYVSHFFPNGRIYVLAGLENVGTIKDPCNYTRKNLQRELDGWRQAVLPILDRSFFATREMDSEFHGKVANGLLPLMLLLLVRSGDTIDGVLYGRLDAAGSFLPEEVPPPARHPGIEVRFHHAGTPRTLYYFSTDLSKGFDANPSFRRFLERHGPADTLVKSASYLLHWKMCSGLRSYILENSNLILEDDTGVPYRYFTAPAWQVRLFGCYSRPSRLFRREYQPDLAVAFQDKTRVADLGFSLGYGYGLRPSSLLLAERVNKLGVSF